MNDLPRGPLGPLDPPPGAFEAVQRAAGRRRLRRAGVASALSLALLAGAFAVGSQLGGGSRPDALVTASAPPEPAPTQVVYGGITHPPSPSAEPPATSGPAVLPTLRPSPTPAAGDLEPVYRGRVVDATGAPVAGAWLMTVIPGEPLQARQVDADGTYEGTCGGPRELIAMWDLRARVQPAGMRNLAATEVVAVSCDDRPEVTTVLREGGTLTGAIRYVDAEGRESSYGTGSNPGGGLYCRPLGLPDDQAQCADWTPVEGRYRFAGLPTGTYGLQGMYGMRSVEVRAGRTTTLDWYECDGCARGERRPAAEPTATP